MITASTQATASYSRPKLYINRDKTSCWEKFQLVLCTAVAQIASNACLSWLTLIPGFLSYHIFESQIPPCARIILTWNTRYMQSALLCPMWNSDINNVGKSSALRLYNTLGFDYPASEAGSNGQVVPSRSHGVRAHPPLPPLFSRVRAYEGKSGGIMVGWGAVSIGANT